MSESRGITALPHNSATHPITNNLYHSPLHSSRSSITRVAPAPIDINHVQLNTPSSYDQHHNNNNTPHDVAIMNNVQFIDPNTINNNMDTNDNNIIISSSDDKHPALHHRQPSTSTNKQTHNTNLYTSQLIHYKLVDDKRNTPLNTSDEPIHIILPNNKILLGQQYKSNDAQSTAIQQARPNITRHSNILMYFNFNIFELPQSLQHKYRVYCILTIVLLLADLSLITSIYFYGGYFDPNLTQYYSGNDIIMYITNILCIILCYVGLYLRDQRILVTFNVLYYISSVISLLRVYSLVQYSHFIIQLAICHTSRVCRMTAAPLWTNPL